MITRTEIETLTQLFLTKQSYSKIKKSYEKSYPRIDELRAATFQLPNSAPRPVISSAEGLYLLGNYYYQAALFFKNYCSQHPTHKESKRLWEMNSEKANTVFQSIDASKRIPSHPLSEANLTILLTLPSSAPAVADSEENSSTFTLSSSSLSLTAAPEEEKDEKQDDGEGENIGLAPLNKQTIKKIRDNNFHAASDAFYSLIQLLKPENPIPEEIIIETLKQYNSLYWNVVSDWNSPKAPGEESEKASEYGFTALMYAAKYCQNPPILEYLIEVNREKIDRIVQDPYNNTHNKQTALEIAIANNNRAFQKIYQSKILQSAASVSSTSSTYFYSSSSSSSSSSSCSSLSLLLTKK